jgi:YegS C-terminal NAD kinase beta sandwich-like domain
VIEKGRPWERPASGPAEWQVEGDDATLAAAVRDHPGARIEFRPGAGSDLARALGLHAGGGTALELGLDGLRVLADDRELFAVNMVVVGAAPDRTGRFTRAPEVRVRVDERVAHDGRATGVVVASGQHLRGADVVPRGHPGDGLIEVQVYAVGRGARAGVRARLPQGVHLPHPDITQTRGRHVEVRADRGPVPLEVDGVAVPPAALVTVDVVPGAFVLVL